MSKLANKNMPLNDIDSQFAEIRQAVVVGDATEFDRCLRKIGYEESAKVWPLLADAHVAGQLNLTLVLEQWLVCAPDAALELMEAMQSVTQPGTDDALRFLLFAARAPESYRYSAAVLLEPAMRLTPGLALELAETLCGADMLDIEAAYAWSIACTRADPVGSVELALAQTGPHSALVLSLVLQCVDMNLPEVIEAVIAQEAAIVARLLSIAMLPLQTVAPWWVLARMSCFSAAATSAVLNAISTADDAATIGLASALSTMKVPAFGTPQIPMSRVVEMLFSEAARSKGVQYAVDQCLALMLRHSATQRDVLDGLVQLGSSEDDVESYLQRTYQILTQKSAWMASVLTKWLVDPNAKGRRIANLIRNGIGKTLTLEAHTLAAAPIEKRLNAARRLLALTHDGETLCSFIKVFAEEPGLQPNGVVTAGEMLNHALAEYPAATTLFLRNRVRDCGKLEKYSPMYRTIYCNALRWKRVLKSLPILKELQPSLSQTQALWAMRRRHNRDVMRGAQEKSIFASISVPVHIVQGRRGAIHRFGESPQIFSLQELSHSIELPTSELADPVGGRLRRAKYLRDAK